MNFKTLLTLYGGGHYHIETSPLICIANQWNGFYLTGTSVMTELKLLLCISFSIFDEIIISASYKLSLIRKKFCLSKTYQYSRKSNTN